MLELDQKYPLYGFKQHKGYGTKIHIDALKNMANLISQRKFYKKYMLNKRQIGTNKEKIAAEYLRVNGYEILEQNFYANNGKIDIIAKDNDFLVFIEVKYRYNDKYGLGYEALIKKKQMTIYKVAQYYMYKNKISFDSKVRFDVVSIDGNKVQILKNAFMI